MSSFLISREEFIGYLVSNSSVRVNITETKTALFSNKKYMSELLNVNLKQFSPSFLRTVIKISPWRVVFSDHFFLDILPKKEASFYKINNCIVQEAFCQQKYYYWIYCIA